MPAAIAKPANAIGMTQNVTYFPELGMSEEAFTHHLDSLKWKFPNWKLAAMLPKNSMHISEAWKQVRDILENLPADERPAEGKDLKLVSTEIYQSKPVLGDRSHPAGGRCFQLVAPKEERADHAG